jgi:hypothetical protein
MRAAPHEWHAQTRCSTWKCVACALFDRLGRYEPAATVAGFASNPLSGAAFPETSTAAGHVRDALGNEIYESRTRKGETMTTAAMATYAYDQVDQARAERRRSRNRRHMRVSNLRLEMTDPPTYSGCCGPTYSMRTSQLGRVHESCALAAGARNPESVTPTFALAPSNVPVYGNRETKANPFRSTGVSGRHRPSVIQ